MRSEERWDRLRLATPPSHHVPARTKGMLLLLLLLAAVASVPFFAGGGLSALRLVQREPCEPCSQLSHEGLSQAGGPAANPVVAFLSQTPNLDAPAAADGAEISGKQHLADWKPWELPQSLLKYFPSPSSALLNPSRFRLNIKLLTFNRVNATQRILNSLVKVDYLGDTVNLEVYIDHPHNPEDWARSSPEEQARRIKQRNVVLDMIDATEWPHGRKMVHARETKGGMQPQWMEAWWPEDVNEFVFVAEDDMEVSPFMYMYFKQLVMFYYYNQSNFDPQVYGISFERQDEVLAGRSPRIKEYPTEHFLYTVVGTWGQFLFPIQWKEFRRWYEDHRFNASSNPGVKETKLQWRWNNRGNSIWSTWHIKWAYVRHMYSLYVSFPNTMSLSVSHREQGESFNSSAGPDATLVTAAEMPAGLLYTHQAFSHERGYMKLSPVDLVNPNRVKGVFPDIPPWWTHMPSRSGILKFDLCFHRVPPRTAPTRTLEELKAAIPDYSKDGALAIVPVPGTPKGYLDVRNWLCHAQGLDTRAFLLVFSLMPTSEAVVSPTPPGCTPVSPEAWNAKVEESAADLARRGYLVHVMAAGQGPLPPLVECTAEAGRVHFLLSQAELVEALIKSGSTVLISSLQTMLNLDPFGCFLQREGPKTPPFTAWLFQQVKPPEASLKETVALVIRVKGTPEGAEQFKGFLDQWRAAGVPEFSALPSGVYDWLLKDQRGFLLTNDAAAAPVNHAAFETCVIASTFPGAGKHGDTWKMEQLGRPGVVIVPIMHGPFVSIEPVQHSCIEAKCKKTV